MPTVRSSNEIVFDVLKAALFEHEFPDEESIDWSAVFCEMQAQTVAALPGEWISKIQLPDDVKRQWSVYVYRQLYNWRRIMHEQTKTVRLLQEHGIPVAILKGSAAGMYYPNPELRVCGDVDFFVLPEQFDITTELLLENGYALGEQAGHHWAFRKNNVEFELHKYPAGVEKGYESLMPLICEGMNSLTTEERKGMLSPVFPQVQNGLVLLLHIVHHLHGGMGLRQICDWMMFADRCLQDEFYYREFQPVLKKAGLEPLAAIVTRMCQLYLGLTEAITWCKDADPVMCRETLNHIMECGNFGYKRSTDDPEDSIQATRIQHHLRHPFAYLKGLHEKGKAEWKVLRRCPILTPFAWLYKLCSSIGKLFRLVFKGGFFKRMRAAKERDHLFTELHMTQGYIKNSTTSDKES